MQNLGERAAAAETKNTPPLLLTVGGLSGELVKTSDVAGVSGHAILPGFITLPISQAHSIHYSSSPEEFFQAPWPQVL